MRLRSPSQPLQQPATTLCAEPWLPRAEAARAGSSLELRCATTLEQECIAMSAAMEPHRNRRTGIAACLPAVFAAVLVAGLSASGAARAQASHAGPAPASAAAPAAHGDGADLQGLWDFTMRVGERTSPGFFALGPLDGAWAGSITMYLTNTLAIRDLTVEGDAVRMIVASREGDVRFLARLTEDGNSMEGVVEYHDGSRLPMLATRRVQPVIPR